METYIQRRYKHCDCGNLFLLPQLDPRVIVYEETKCPQCKEKKYFNQKITTPSILLYNKSRGNLFHKAPIKCHSAKPSSASSKRTKQP